MFSRLCLGRPGEASTRLRTENPRMFLFYFVMIKIYNLQFIILWIENSVERFSSVSLFSSFSIGRSSVENRGFLEQLLNGVLSEDSKKPKERTLSSKRPLETITVQRNNVLIPAASLQHCIVHVVPAYFNSVRSEYFVLRSITFNWNVAIRPRVSASFVESHWSFEVSPAENVITEGR